MDSCADSYVSVLTLCLSSSIMYSSCIGKCICGVSQNAGESGKKQGIDYFVRLTLPQHRTLEDGDSRFQIPESLTQ